MAKRAPKDERPFNPIESALVERVASRSPFYEPRNAVLPEIPDETAAQPTATQVIKRPPREKRVLLSWEEELALQRLLDQLTETLQTPVKLSNALRSCLILLRQLKAQSSIAQLVKESWFDPRITTKPASLFLNIDLRRFFRPPSSQPASPSDVLELGNSVIARTRARYNLINRGPPPI